MTGVNTPGDNIRKICEALGQDYYIRVIDKENVIYRSLGNGYSFEISGLDNRKKSLDATLYIWDDRNGTITEMISDIRSVAELDFVLNNSVKKYLSAVTC